MGSRSPWEGVILGASRALKSIALSAMQTLVIITVANLSLCRTNQFSYLEVLQKLNCQYTYHQNEINTTTQYTVFTFINEKCGIISKLELHLYVKTTTVQANKCVFRSLIVLSSYTHIIRINTFDEPTG